MKEIFEEETFFAGIDSEDNINSSLNDSDNFLYLYNRFPMKKANPTVKEH